MKNKFHKCLKNLLVVLFWLLVWHITSLIIDNAYFLPGINDVFYELGKAIIQINFWRTIVATILRVIGGLSIGFIFGVVIGTFCHGFSLIKSLFAPFIAILKSTPVASFIILLWSLMNGNMLAVVVAVIMVFPLICESTISALDTVDTELKEVCTIFKIPFLKRLRHLIFPTLFKFLAPALVTSVGLAWKSEVAAEIIAYISFSIGANINNAHAIFNTPLVFAWTGVVISLSIVLEHATRKIVERLKWA